MSHTKEEELDLMHSSVSKYIEDHGHTKWSDMSNDQRAECARYVTDKLHETFSPESRLYVFVRSIDESDKHQIHAIEKSLWNHRGSECVECE